MTGKIQLVVAPKEHSTEVEKLLKEAFDMLASLEWADDEIYGDFCPVCNAQARVSHTEHCEMQALLNKIQQYSMTNTTSASHFRR